MSRRISRSWLLVVLACTSLGAQTPPARRGLPVVSDSVRMLPGSPLTFDTFFDNVSRHHPVVKQARLIEAGAEGDVTAAFGNFEPKLEASWQTKRFGSSTTGAPLLYFNYADIALKIPTPLGADFKVGFERASGQFINPQFTHATKRTVQRRFLRAARATAFSPTSGARRFVSHARCAASHRPSVQQ